MNNIIKKIAFLLSIVALVVVAGCKDERDPEVKELKVSRLFSPTSLELIVVQQTSIRLNWRPVKNAQTYTIEFFESANLNFTGTPVRTVTGVTSLQLPLTVRGFAGDTDYAVRIKAIGPDIGESKWTSGLFKTGTEQIFLPVNPDELFATRVTLKWPAGETATHIMLTPGNINRTVTAAEVTAGAAIITGLTGETTYTARLMNGTKIRGTITFTTLIDLGGAIAVYPKDDLNAAILAAPAGSTLALFPGAYNAYKGDITVNKSITVKGFYPTNRPVINIRFILASGATDLIFENLEMVGTYPESATKLLQAFLFDAGTYTVNSLTIKGSIIREYNQALVYGGTGVVRLNTLNIDNNVMSNIVNDGGDFIDFRTGFVANLNVTNSTFNRVAAMPRDFIRLDNSSANFPGQTSNVVINRCTFFQVSNTRRILYVRFVSNASTVSNTIFAGADASYTGYFSNQAATTQPVCSRNNYWNAPSFLGGVTSGKFDISGTHTTLNPGFVNPEAGNFKVTNETLILNGIGDPRWLN